MEETTVATCENCPWTATSTRAALDHSRQSGHRARSVTTITRVHDATAPINQVVAAMDRIGLPAQAGGYVARRALREAGVTFSNDALAAAIRARKNR